MATANKLNIISKCIYGYLNFDSLDQGKPYKVLALNVFKSNAFNRERDCVRVNIENGYLLLPERFDGLVSELQSLKIEKLYIIYYGREGKGNKLKIEFEERD